MNRLSAFAIICSSLLLSACAQVDLFGLDPDNFSNNNGGGPGTSLVCEDTNADFSTDIIPIFAASCTSGCHSGATPAGDLDLDITDNIGPVTESALIGYLKELNTGIVNTGTPVSSGLLTRPLAESAGGASHSADVFADTSDPDYLAIRCWIEDNAQNDLTDSQCTFGEDVYPMFTNRGCAANNCHIGTGNASGGNLSLSVGTDGLDNTDDLIAELQETASATGSRIDLDNDAQSLILTKPRNQVTHSGMAVFPDANDPDYQKLLCWIEEGAQNN
ncbi:MAG: hypothetical protein KDK51_02580 [Deltaproteobacteria bacterium]|nr:hypothetical protein [Deltaproteobacteria bacterium]